MEILPARPRRGFVILAAMSVRLPFPDVDTVVIDLKRRTEGEISETQ